MIIIVSPVLKAFRDLDLVANRTWQARTLLILQKSPFRRNIIPLQSRKGVNSSEQSELLQIASNSDCKTNESETIARKRGDKQAELSAGVLCKVYHCKMPFVFLSHLKQVAIIPVTTVGPFDNCIMEVDLLIYVCHQRRPYL